MNQPQTLEEVMRRIRAQVGETGSDAVANKRTSQTTATQVSDIGQRLQMNSTSLQLPGAKEGASAPAPVKLKLHETSQLHTEIKTALEGARQVGQINPRNPGLINSFIQLVKKVMRRSLTWYTRPLHHFQGAMIRALDQIAAILDNHNDSFRKVVTAFESQASALERTSLHLKQISTGYEQKSENLERQISSFEQTREEGAKLLEVKLRDLSLSHEGRIAAVMAAQNAALAAVALPQSEQIARLSGQLEALRSELLTTRAELRDANARGRVRDRDIRRTLYSLQNGPTWRDDKQSNTPPMFRSEIKSDKEFDYFAFEDIYRGDEADIRNRQKEYLEYFRGHENVVDIGCGRGEFLELLRDNNISARGVELGLDQYLLCREKGLDVVQQDLFSFLESLPDESLGGLFSAQVIEHLTASDQFRYVALAHRKTMPGSPVIFETINAECVYAVMRNFFMDPTHIRPVHPETLKFAMETMQFKKVELRFSGPVSDKQIPPLKLNGDTPELAEFNRSMQKLNDLIYGYQDYAAIGWR